MYGKNIEGVQGSVSGWDKWAPNGTHLTIFINREFPVYKHTLMKFRAL